VAKAAMDSGVARRPLADLRRYARELSGRLDPTAGALDAIMESVRANPKRVVFAEGEEETTVRAAVAYRNAGYGTPVLIGREELVRETIKNLGITDDGMEIHNQLFLPKDLKPGDRRPAIVFVHGGPVRQMMPAYHYMQFYGWSYGINEWLANQGYVVMSINYRSGVGYGRSFRTAPKTGGDGNSEYQDVVAGGKYLQSRPDVDPNRVGIWGLSYGGVLTSQALARNSDIFKVGVDLAGVHLWGSSLDPAAVSYQSSTIGAIDGWKSPVLLIQGDDDRNVAFQQMTGLVQLLRQRDVYYELIVFPDDTHESLLHSRWLYTLGRMDTFLHKFLGESTSTGANR